MAYVKIPYELGKATTVLQSCPGMKKPVKIRRSLPGNVIVVHGVNDVGTTYKAVEDGLCQGLAKRLCRGFTPGEYRMPTSADKEKIFDDPDAVFYKRTNSAITNSPVIPFYWGYRELDIESKTANGQKTDRNGNRLDKDLSKGGGPFGNATSTLPDMWNRGIYAPVDISGDPLRPLKTAPGRMYMVLAAKRLAALIAMIHDYAEDDAVTIVAHSQGCMLTLLAQAFLMEQGLRTAETLILTHPPYSLEESTPLLVKGLNMLDGDEDSAMKPHYGSIDDTQTLHGRLQTLVNIVRGVVEQKPVKDTPAFSTLGDQCLHHGMVEQPWKAEADRDNRGKVYLYFCPEDMTVALQNIQGIGWQGVPDLINGTQYQWRRVLKASRGGLFEQTGWLPQVDTREALNELGDGFRQRVFTGKCRFDPRTKKVGPVLVGQPPHDFALRLKGEDDLAHVVSTGRTFQVSHPAVAWPIDTSKKWAEQRLGIRRITGEALNPPVPADVLGNQIEPQELPDDSPHAKLKAADQGPWEEVDPTDAAVAIANNAGLRRRAEERPDPSGNVHYPGSPQDLPRSELKKMAEIYNLELGATNGNAKRTIIRAVRNPDGKVMALVQESPNEGILRWQHELSAKSFHGAIIGNSENHRRVTAYDVAIGGGKAATDPKFYAYLCAVADWRLKKPMKYERRRPGILFWHKFEMDFQCYLTDEPPWRMELINGNADYYSTGVLPTCLPVLVGELWDIVISETMDGKRVTSSKDKR